MQRRDDIRHLLRQATERTDNKATLLYSIGKRSAPSDFINVEFTHMSYKREFLVTYERVKWLHAGKDAIVVLMIRRRDNKYVIAKVMFEEKISRREATILTAIQEDRRTQGIAPHLYNFVHLFEWNNNDIAYWTRKYAQSDDDIPDAFYVMIVEFIDGQRLDRLRYTLLRPSEEYVSVKDARLLVASGIRMLRRLEAAGIYHGDLHGGNIIVLDDDVKTMRLIDFGQSCVFDTSLLAPRIMPALRCSDGEFLDRFNFKADIDADYLRKRSRRRLVRSLLNTLSHRSPLDVIFGKIPLSVYPPDADIIQQLKTFIA